MPSEQDKGALVILSQSGGRVEFRPGYFYLFGENRDWNSRDNSKIFGKVKKFWAA